MKREFNENSKFKEILDKEKENKRADIHSFHRYFWKLIPAIPSAFIKEFTKEGDTIWDLFSWSWTVAVEAKLNNRDFLWCEINPLSTFISEVKTTSYNVDELLEINKEIESKLRDENYTESLVLDDVPFCVNLEHRFKPEVIKDLLVIEATVKDVVWKLKCSKDKKDNYLRFYLSVISSIIRNVSNADPQHVFPWISKRVRKMEAEWKIHKNAKKTFIAAIKKRANYFRDYEWLKDTSIQIMNGDSVNDDFSKYKWTVDLFVTNPPYISSVRYIETMKLEMYRMEYLKSQTEYWTLAKVMVWNDKVAKKEINNELLTPYEEINEKIQELRNIDNKNAFIVAKYFIDMEKIIRNMNIMLKKWWKVVVKISESNVKRIKIDTWKFLTIIAENNWFKLVDVFLDKINENSRSLTTARNTYSDIILNDNIIIWEKVK